MSSYVFPALPGLKAEIGYSLDYRTSVYESPGGSEQRVSWRATPRTSYRLSWSVLRDDVAAPSPWNAYSELGALLFFWNQHRGPGDVFVLDDPHARKNLLAYSQSIGTSPWTLTHLSASASVAAPDGSTTAQQMTEDSATTVVHYTEQPVSVAASTTVTLSVHGKASERNWLYVAIVQRDATTVKGQWINLSTGALGTADSGVTAAVTSLGSSWYRCAASANVGTGGSDPKARFTLGTGDNQASYTGDGVSDLHLWGAQLEAASSAGLYVPTGAAGITGLVNVRFVDDSLSFRRIIPGWYEAECSVVTVL